MTTDSQQALDDFPLSDAHLISVSFEDSQVLVRLRDWQEQPLDLEFVDAVLLEAQSPGEREISCGTEDRDDVLLKHPAVLEQDDPSEYRCFVFWDAWDEDIAVVK